MRLPAYERVPTSACLVCLQVAKPSVLEAKEPALQKKGYKVGRYGLMSRLCQI